MNANLDQTTARPLFRSMAAGVGIVCLILAIIFVIFPVAADTNLPAYACAAVGVIMVGIALTGRWPWWGRGRSHH
jgi:protein-S-isoprenylcysteine O-methyltransferase Ste14